MNDTRFEIRSMAVWGRARYLSVIEVPHNIESSWLECTKTIRHESSRQFERLKLCAVCIIFYFHFFKSSQMFSFKHFTLNNFPL